MPTDSTSTTNSNNSTNSNSNSTKDSTSSSSDTTTKEDLGYTLHQGEILSTSYYPYNYSMSWELDYTGPTATGKVNTYVLPEKDLKLVYKGVRTLLKTGWLQYGEKLPTDPTEISKIKADIKAEVTKEFDTIFKSKISAIEKALKEYEKQAKEQAVASAQTSSTSSSSGSSTDSTSSSSSSSSSTSSSSSSSSSSKSNSTKSTSKNKAHSTAMWIKGKKKVYKSGKSKTGKTIYREVGTGRIYGEKYRYNKKTKKWYWVPKTG